MNLIKVGLIGAGYMASEHAKVFANIPGFKIVAICSRTEEKATALAKKYEAQVFKNIATMFDNLQPDLVIVAVNELSMLSVCQEVFNYPWLCFLEKPVGYNYEQAVKITALATEKGHKPYVALNRRAYSATRLAVEHLQNDASPRLVSILDQQDMDAARKMGQPELVVTNYMFANSIHLVDYFNLFCRGELLSVTPVVAWDHRNPQFVVATLQYSSGDIGIYQAIWNGPGPWSVSITNATNRLEMRPLESLKIQKRGERQFQEIAVNNIDVHYKPGLYHQGLELLQYFQGNKTSLVTLEEATRSMQLCAKIYSATH